MRAALHATYALMPPIRHAMIASRNAICAAGAHNGVAGARSPNAWTGAVDVEIVIGAASLSISATRNGRPTAGSWERNGFGGGEAFGELVEHRSTQAGADLSAQRIRAGEQSSLSEASARTAIPDRARSRPIVRRSFSAPDRD